jgi:chemotaxis regulatin CheY-phosphate phosphatase CheZ
VPPEPDVSIMFSTLVRMIGDVERTLTLPRDDMRVLEERLVQLEERLTGHMTYSEKAVDIALSVVDKSGTALDHKLETLVDQAKTFMTQEVYNSNHRLLVVKVESLQRFMYIITGALLVIQVLIGFIEKIAMP